MQWIIAVLILTFACAALAAECKDKEATFKKCPVQRLAVINGLFEAFAEHPTDDSMDVNVLREVWNNPVLLTDVMRTFASPEQIIQYCDVNKDGIFTRQELIDNKCECIENCMWASRVNILLARAKNNPGWRQAAQH